MYYTEKEAGDNMLDNYRVEMIRISEGFTEKEKEKYNVEHLINLSEKLRDCEDQDVINLMLSLKDQLNEEKVDLKTFRKDYSSLTTIVSSRFGLKEKGSLQGQYAGLGIALGAGLGAAFTSVFTASLAIFIGAGLAIGTGIGSQKEKEAEEKDLLF